MQGGMPSAEISTRYQQLSAPSAATSRCPVALLLNTVQPDAGSVWHCCNMPNPQRLASHRPAGWQLARAGACRVRAVMRRTGLKPPAGAALLSSYPPLVPPVGLLYTTARAHQTLAIVQEGAVQQRRIKMCFSS